MYLKRVSGRPVSHLVTLCSGSFMFDHWAFRFVLLGWYVSMAAKSLAKTLLCSNKTRLVSSGLHKPLAEKRSGLVNNAHFTV